MSQRVYVFFNRAKGFDSVYKDLNAYFGPCEIVALVPRDYEATAEEMAGATVRPIATGARQLPLLMRDAVRLRGEHPDAFVIFFESIKLRLLAAAIAPGRVVWWRGKEYSLDLPTSMGATLLEHARLRCYGLWTLARFYGSVYLRRFPLQ